VRRGNESSNENAGEAGAGAKRPARLIDAGFTAHPSLLKIPADINPVTLPLSIVLGDKDPSFKLARVQQTKAILEKEEDGQYEVLIIPGAKHGFAIRGDPKGEEAQRQRSQAKMQALGWFERWMDDSNLKAA